MHSPLSFLIFVMSTFFFADMIPGIFRTLLRILWMSCCLFFLLFFSDAYFYALAQIFQSLFLFFGCASPLLDESLDFSIFGRQIFAHFCCCRCRHARFISVVLDLARVAAGMEHDRTCFFILMRKSCTKVFFSFVFRMFFTLRALFRQSLPCRLVVFTVFSYVVTHTGCRRPPVLTSVLKLSWNTPLVCYCAAAFHASSFDLLCFCFLKCAVSFCCCGVFSFDLCFCVLPCASFPFVAAAFFIVSTISWIFFRARAFQS